MKAKPTMETRRQAETLWNEEISKAACLKPYKLAEKLEYWIHLLHAMKRAMYHRGVVLNPRNYAHPDFAKVRLQVVEAAIERGLLWEQTSPPGAEKMSRLFALPPLRELLERDPLAFDPDEQRQFVFLKTRDEEKRNVLSFEKLMAKPDWHVANDAQKKLEIINRVNSLYEITHRHYSEWERCYVGRRQIRPVHYAIFTQHWGWHGRLYTGRYGHQSLRKIERQSILFNGCPSVELDYGGMHARLLYHLAGIDYQADPYALWGKRTTPALRLLAKDEGKGLLLIEGAVPGATNGTVRVRRAKKQGKK